jgi:hypothetical protein
MSYLKDREIWLSSVPTGNPPAGYVWVFIQNGVFVVRDSNGVDKIMATTTGTVTNATSASYVEYSNVANKPALISGSSQVSYTGLSNTPAGIVSGSTQVSFNGIVDKPTLVSGSSQITYSGLTGVPAGIVSSSAQVGEYGIFATTGSNQFNGSQAITGSLTVTGQVVAQTLNVQQVTSSIVFSSGSNIFGNSVSNTQQFTGSLQVTGSTHYLLGNMGIGTTSPDVFSRGDERNVGISVPGASDNLALALNAGGSAGRGAQIYMGQGGTRHLTISSNATETRVGTTTSTPLILTTNDTTRLTIAASTGAATFSSSVTTNAANSFKISSGPYNAVFHNDSTSTSDYNAIRVTQGAVGSATGYIGTGGSAVGNTSFQNTFVIGTQTSNALVLNTNDAERMRITSGGNVGINESSPSSMLHFSRQTTWGSTDNRVININNTGTGGDINVAHNMGSITWYSGNSTPTAEIAAYRNTPASGNNIELRFYTANAGTPSERMRITSGGNVGIGVTIPSGQLSIKNQISNGSNPVSSYAATNGVEGQNFFNGYYAENSDGLGSYPRYFDIVSTGSPDGSNGGSNIRFFTNPIANNSPAVERMRITSDGYLRMASGTGGIQFNGDTAAANALDDYEEGSWTPELQNATVSYSNRSGSYVKIGNYVFVRWGFRISSISGKSGTVTISGLPFTSVSWGSYQEPNIGVSTGVLATADLAQRARLFVGGSTTSLFGRIANNSDTTWDTGELQNGSWIIGEIFYNV